MLAPLHVQKHSRFQKEKELHRDKLIKSTTRLRFKISGKLFDCRSVCSSLDTEKKLVLCFLSGKGKILIVCKILFCSVLGFSVSYSLVNLCIACHCFVFLQNGGLLECHQYRVGSRSGNCQLWHTAVCCS